MNIKDKLIHALTEYDRKQSKRRAYNPHALGIYFNRLDEVCADIDRGASVRQALLNGFNDRLLDVCLKAVGEPLYTRDQMHAQSIYYVPASDKQATKGA